MASTAHSSQERRKGVVGNSQNFWLYSSQDGFDLSHSDAPDSAPIGTRIQLSTASLPVTIDPGKTALVVIDMQNFFLSPVMGRDTQGAGHKAVKQLVKHAIPAAREAGIRVIWLNWGLTQQEVDDMPPAIKRAFGFEAVPDHEPLSVAESQHGHAVDRDGVPRQQSAGIVLQQGKDAKIYKGLGRDCGTLKDPQTGEEVIAGKLLMRDQWNAALLPPLDQMYEEGCKLKKQPDVWIHKNRMSGLWGARTELEDFLEDNGIRTLLFSGVNTDQCVTSTLQDAFSKGYDCILLSDGSGTSSPEYAQQCVEFNSARSWGFVATCEQFAEGVARAISR